MPLCNSGRVQLCADPHRRACEAIAAGLKGKLELIPMRPSGRRFEVGKHARKVTRYGFRTPLITMADWVELRP